MFGKKQRWSQRSFWNCYQSCFTNEEKTQEKVLHTNLVLLYRKNKNQFLKNLCRGTQCGGFQFLLILDLWGISFHAVVVFPLGKNLLFKFALGHCEIFKDDISCSACLELVFCFQNCSDLLRENNVLVHYSDWEII